MPTYATFLLGGDLSLRCLSKPTHTHAFGSLTPAYQMRIITSKTLKIKIRTHTHTLIKFRHQKWVFYLQHVHFREINFYTHIDT